MKNMRIHGLCTFVALVVAASVAHAQYTVLYNFGSHSGDPLQPTYSGIIAQGRDGSLYSTSVSGGTAQGTVFKITPTGTVKVLFNSDAAHGASPYGGLTLGSDGKLYGTATTAGPTSCCGTVFKITSSGTLTVLHNFGGPDGGAPQAPPIQGSDGKFYGTTAGGVGTPNGTVYQITSAGKFKTLFVFDVTHGSYPAAPLIQGTDGNFYGTTVNGGGNSKGEVFRITSKGVLTVLFSFDGAHGVSPTGPLVQAGDGNFYGTTFGGGANNFGTVFKMASDGTTSVIHDFNFSPDGGRPTAGLVQATDGNFYGATSDGGNLGFATLYKITPGGMYTVLYTFDQTTGAYPLVTLTQHTNGTLYGDTQKGGLGPNNCGAQCSGVFYALSGVSGPFVGLVTRAAKIGKTIGILGQGFTGTTAVSFGTTPSTFKVVSTTYLTATVPFGASSGVVTVTTPGGTLSSNKEFIVLP